MVHTSEQIDLLARRAQAGDRAALAALVQSQQRYVYSIALGVMKEPADAADMSQEAFVRLMRSLHTYRGETRFTTWLYRLVTNLCLDELRRRRGVVESLNAGDDEEGGDRADALPDRDRWAQPEHRAELSEASREVRAALDQLAPMQRLALPVNTVKSHIHRGKARMAQLLGAGLGRPAVAARPTALPTPANRWARGLGTRVAQARPLLTAASAA